MVLFESWMSRPNEDNSDVLLPSVAYCQRKTELIVQAGNKGVVPGNGRKKKANCINLSHADIAKLIKASNSEEVSEYENHTQVMK
ncbi:hypothetical protein TNCV_5058421 [Trichonephila clavipes]|nr:hypothetical protein TNCV_5058421 [Trichonephila clavipes]